MPLRIVHVGKFYPPHFGGMESHLHDLCTGLRQEVEPSVIVANDRNRTTVDDIQGVNVVKVATLGLVASTPICPGMRTRIRNTSADIIHLHHPNPMSFAAYLAANPPGRLVVTYHSDIVRQQRLGWAFHPLLQQVLDRSAAIIVTSPAIVQNSPVLAPYRDRCHVIPYGIALEKFETFDAVKVAEIRKQYGPRIVLAVGRLVYYKGFDYLIRAMAKVDGQLLLVGDGPLRPKLEEEARKMGVAERVKFLGEVQDCVAFYQAADVFVLPSVASSEAFGIVQLEAMACGKPVVNTKLKTGVPFVSLHNITGITAQPSDSAALAGAISLLLDNPTLRARYGAAARKRAREEFALELMVRRTAALYREILGAGKILESVDASPK